MNSPLATRSQAATMASAMAAGSTPSSLLASAAPFFTYANACTNNGSDFIGMPVMAKFSIARRVWMP